MANAVLNLSELNGSSNGFVINGINERDFSGTSVSSAGDINGDGIDDVIIGAPDASPNGQRGAGSSYVVFSRSSDFGAGLNLSDLDGSNGFVINGINSFDSLGYSVSSAGDINGDGIDDLIIGARAASPNGQRFAGSSYVVFGRSSGFGASLNLSDLDGSNGFVINGIDADDFSGRSVSSAGDINGDGIDDLIIGADGADPNGQRFAGSSYVVFGRSSGFSAGLNLSDLDGSNGFVINGINNYDYSGTSVSSAGDINGDGIDDLIIGAPFADPNGQYRAGESYVVFGRSSGFGASLNLSDLDGSNGFVINGDINDNSGTSVSSAGDINGDGFDDLIIGANRASPNSQYRAGSSYVVFGRSSGFRASLNLSSFLNGSNGFVINGINARDYSGGFVSSAGDINGDGFDDLIIGATGADPNRVDSNIKESYVVFGRNIGFGASLNLSDLDGSNGFVINGIDNYEFSGNSVSSAGDINGDGFDDLIIGVRGASPNGQDRAGESYVVFGFASPTPTNKPPVIVNDVPKVASVFNLSFLDRSNGFVINGINRYDSSGRSVSSAGDINGDGIDDLIIGAPFADPNGLYDAGSSYVVFGRSSGFGAGLDLSDLDGSNGFVINGIDERDFSGNSVSSAGDINGDGIDDLIIGARGADPNGQDGAGSSYVVFGRSSDFGAGLNLSDLDGSNGFVINGINSFDSLGYSVSSAGDINGDGIDDLIIAASGADPNGLYDAGSSYVVFGRSSGFGAGLNLSDLDGSNGFVINGIDERDFSGNSVSSAGDINGDGIDDLIIAASGADPNGQDGAGSSYVVFGRSSGFGAGLNLSELDGSNGFVINGINRYDSSGNSVSSAGDINGDGFDDLIIGARFADPNGQDGAGSSYVVFGRSSDFGAGLNLSDLDGSNGFVINGINRGDRLGYSVSSAGDINGDGIDDLIIGAPYADPNGQDGVGSSYVVFGRSSGFGASLNLSSLDGSNGFVINDGINNYDYSGSYVSSAGDINGDGIDDLIIGVTYADPNGQDRAGSSYVVFGFATAATTNEDTAINILASNILRRYTDAEGDAFTISNFTNPSNGILSFNDNGTQDNPSDDFFIYTPNANFNGTDDFNFTVSDGNGGNTIGTFNLNVKPVNDAPIAVNDSLTTGFNTAVSIQASTLLANDTDIDSSNLSITGVSGVTNGTAVLNDNSTPDNSADDFIVFTPLNGLSGNAKFNYTISDGSLTDTAKVAIAVGAKITGTNGNDTISGTPGDDKICGGNGNDTICGGKGNDTISGGNGKDTIFGGQGNDILTGGNGKDTIFGGQGNDILTGGNASDKFILASKEGTDIITDFCKGTDLIGLSGGLTFGQLSFRGNNILVTSTPEILATLTGIKTTTLTVSDFISV